MSSKLRFAVIGCGRVAVKHIKAALQNREMVELVAVSDISREFGEKLLSQSPLSEKQKKKIKIYSDHIEMMENEKPDIVAVTTPSGTHGKIGRDVLERKIHLLMEKPMTLSPKEADMLIEKSRENGVKIALGHIYRFFPLVDILSRDIGEGNFGKILYGSVKVFWGHDQKYYSLAPWRGTWEQDGGVLMNQSVHALDLMLYLMGGNVSSVTSMIARQTHDIQAEDLAMGIMRFENNSFCTVEGTTNSDPKNPLASFFVMGTKGSIYGGIKKGIPFFRITGENGKKLNRKYLIKLIKTTLREQGPGGFKKYKNPHSGILRDLVLSIREEREPRACGLSGKNSLELVLAMYKSARDKKEISLPPKNFTTEDMLGYFEEEKS